MRKHTSTLGVFLEPYKVLSKEAEADLQIAEVSWDESLGSFNSVSRRPQHSRQFCSLIRPGSGKGIGKE